MRDFPALMRNELSGAGADRCARIAADLAPVMIWMSGPDKRFEWCNAACEAFTGRSADELQADEWLALMHPEDVERYTGILATASQARQPFTLDYRLRRRDGQYRWMLDNGVPRLDAQGAFAGYVGSVVDIDERKQAEEHLAERAQAFRLAESRQAAFLAMLSHELRNPLAPIANAASVLRTIESSNPILVRLREIIERQVGRLGRLVEDLIDATRSAQGQISLICKPFAVESVVQSAVAASAAQLNRFGHTLDIALPEKRFFVKGDLVRLTQALANIISNAAKFTREPSVISLNVREAGEKVEISVRDPGQGIAPDFLPHVFELFAQQDQSPGGKPDGLGVGLTLARRIVELHDGRIEAFSEGACKGARFVVSLPLIDADFDIDAEAHRQHALGVPPLSETYRVLIIEDDDDSREGLRLQMEMWGNEVRIAANAEEGLRIADAFKPHIVLCEIGLPEVNGFDLLKPLRETLSGQHTLFAAVTGHARQEDEAHALAVGYDSFLVKPLQSASLGRLLRSYASTVH